jgi:hypothetical protein
MQRQNAGRHDVLRYKQDEAYRTNESGRGEHWASYLFDKMYKPLLLGEKLIFRIVSHCTILGLGIGLLVLGAVGLKDPKVGLGLEVSIFN